MIEERTQNVIQYVLMGKTTRYRANVMLTEADSENEEGVRERTNEMGYIKTAGEQIKINERDINECGWWRRGEGGRILQKLRCRHHLKHLVSMYCLLFSLLCASNHHYSPEKQIHYAAYSFRVKINGTSILFSEENCKYLILVLFLSMFHLLSMPRTHTRWCKRGWKWPIPNEFNRHSGCYYASLDTHDFFQQRNR